MQPIVLQQLGEIRAPRTEVIDDFWGNTISTIELDGSLFTSEAVQGLSDYSHLLVVYYLDKVMDILVAHQLIQLALLQVHMQLLSVILIKIID